MNVSVCDSKVRTLSVGTGEALGVDPFRRSPPAFDFAPRAHRERLCWLLGTSVRNIHAFLRTDVLMLCSLSGDRKKQREIGPSRHYRLFLFVTTFNERSAKEPAHPPT